jgi:hypothetical protein
MIVSSMTYDEIRKEIQNDVELVYKKSTHVITELERKMRREKLKKHLHVYEYNSKNKNKWIVKIDIGPKDVGRTFMTHFYVDNKIVAVQVIDSPFLLYYTAHFFKRYRERLTLEIAKPEELIRHYLTGSSHFVPKILEKVDNNLLKMYIVGKQGTILGTLHVNTGICKMNTFLSPSMLKSDQVEMEKEMKERLNKYNLDSGRLD